MKDGDDIKPINKYNNYYNYEKLTKNVYNYDNLSLGLLK